MLGVREEDEAEHRTPVLIRGEGGIGPELVDRRPQRVTNLGKVGLSTTSAPLGGAGPQHGRPAVVIEAYVPCRDEARSQGRDPVAPTAASPARITTDPEAACQRSFGLGPDEEEEQVQREAPDSARR